VLSDPYAEGAGEQGWGPSPLENVIPVQFAIRDGRGRRVVNRVLVGKASWWKRIWCWFNGCDHAVMRHGHGYVTLICRRCGDWRPL
jgi:hypothetical protein